MNTTADHIMNTTASYSSENSWCRRCSTETIFSIQGKETDFVCDTSDTDGLSSDDELGVQYEPATDAEEPALLSAESSGQSDNEIISTHVLAVSVGDDGELQLADSEQTDTDGDDSEMDFYDYWNCAQCKALNNNPLYRYCQKCFKVRKNFFPPRPKRKHKCPAGDPEEIPRTFSQDSGVASAPNSQESQGTSVPDDAPPPTVNNHVNKNKAVKRRRAESADRHLLNDYSDSDSETNAKRVRNSKSVDVEVKPLVKTISDPALTIENPVKLTKKAIANAIKQKLDPKDDLCIVCCSEPKSGVFVHGRIAHICCCYKCAVKVWNTVKRCPVCNCKVSNVLKAVVM